MKSVGYFLLVLNVILGLANVGFAIHSLQIGNNSWIINFVAVIFSFVIGVPSSLNIIENSYD